jgi:hypothetical protein
MKEVIMTAAAGAVFMTSIVPIIEAAIGRGLVRPVGSEDREELIADCTAQAAAMLDSAERAGKEIIPKSIAHYAIQSVKSGRRFGSAGRTDAMSPGAALDGAVCMRSLDEPVGGGEDDPDSEFSLHDLLAGPGEDVDRAAARSIDWESLEEHLDDRKRMVLHEVVSGYGTSETASKLAVSPPRVIQLRRQCAVLVRDMFGDAALQDCLQPSAWRAGLRASRGY